MVTYLNWFLESEHVFIFKIVGNLGKYEVWNFSYITLVHWQLAKFEENI